MVAHENKFAILGILGFRALGDFVEAGTDCIYVKRRLRNSALLVYAQDDRPYNQQLIEPIEKPDE